MTNKMPYTAADGSSIMERFYYALLLLLFGKCLPFFTSLFYLIADKKCALHQMNWSNEQKSKHIVVVVNDNSLAHSL